jgi:long-subunit acyl-CoA synthetase (AMP-forming)
VTESFVTKGILTNTMKLIRYEARNYFKNEIEAMYSEGTLPGQ